MEQREWTLEQMAAVLDKPRIRNGELRACCPAHGGDAPNLSLTYEGGRLLATCHSHRCAFGDIVSALRERLGDDAGSEVRVKTGKKKRKRRQTGQTVWEIRDERAELVAYHVRFDYADGDKEVKWRLPSGEWSLKPAKLSPADMPLYGVREAIRTPPDTPVVVTEGEKAADALRASGVAAVGTVTGSKGTPGARALAPLRGRKVVLWPDADLDGQGHEHMGRVAAGLHEASADVHWFEWDGAPDKGDAADYLESYDAQTLKKDLSERAVRWSRPPAIEGLIRNFGELMDRGIEEPEELLPDILLKGKAHNIFGPGGIGKTWVLVWMAKELVEAGKRVVILDVENGLRTYLERFDEVGTDRTLLNRNFVYGPFLSFDPESYARMLDDEKPDVVMFDSWIGFLAADGRDENVANDIALWADGYSKPALKRGVTVVVLDHVGHEHSERERGARRKRDEMDVVWKLKRSRDFDRKTRGSLEMFLEKDREGWLPTSVAWEIGGGESFAMRREDALASLLAVAFLDSKERAVLDSLKEHESITAKRLLEKVGRVEKMSRPTLYRVLTRLQDKGRAKRVGAEWKFIEVEPTLEDSAVIGDLSQVSQQSHGVSRADETAEEASGTEDTVTKRSNEAQTTTPSGVSPSQSVSRDSETGDSGGVSPSHPLKGVGETVRHPPHEDHPDDTTSQRRQAQEERCPHGTPLGYPCDDCEIDELFGGKG